MASDSDLEAPQGIVPQAKDHAAGSARSPARWSRILGGFMRSRVTRVTFLLVVVGLLAGALVDQGGSMWRDIQKLSAPVLVFSFAANIGSLACTMMLWRELLADLGSRISIVDAWRINFISQLGKYVPGKVWQIVAQTELSKDIGVPRDRSAMSGLLTLGVTLVTGGLVGAATVPFGDGGSVTRYLWFLLIVPVGVAILSPPVMNRIIAMMLRALKRPPLEKGVSLSGLLRATVWSILAWICFGLATFALLHRLGDHRPNLILLSIGAYALSWVVGFLALIAPAGLGAREAVLIALISHRTTSSAALAVALLTRGLAIVADAVTGISAALLIGRRGLKRLRSARLSDTAPTTKT